MRLLASLLLLCAAVSAAPQFSQESYEPKPISIESLPNYYAPLSHEQPIHKRAKRAVFAALGIAQACETGWTGQFCENPVCSATGQPESVGQTSSIEILFLKGSCAGSYYIPVDFDASTNLQIHVSASGNPYLNMTNANGGIAEPTSTFVGEGYSLTTYQGIPAGGYSLTVDNQNSPTTECIIEVNTYTDLKVATGFVNTPQDDTPPYGESAVDGVPMYFIAHVYNAAAPSQINAVSIRQGSSLDPTYRSVLTKRYGCGHEFYAGQFSCAIRNSYFYHVDGIDRYGFAFRRTGRFSCMEQITTPAPPPTTTEPITFCHNNGTLLSDSGTNECFCPELYTGTTCKQIQCMNGGLPDPDEGLMCACPDGYHGSNCQDVTCPLNWEPYLLDYKTLVVVVRDTASMAQYKSAISTAIVNEIAHNAQYNTEVYKGFILVKFANNLYTSTYYPQYSQDKFIADLNTTSTVTGGCNDTIFDPLASIFNLAVYQKSPIYLFTDAIALDADKWQTVTESNTREKLPIYSFFLGQSGCNNDVLSPGFRAIQTASYFSGGLVVQPDPDNLAVTFQTVIKATTYKMNSVLIDDMQQCGTPSARVFFADSSTTNIIILAIGESLILSVVDPNGNTNTLLPIITTGTTFFYEIAAPVVGEHLLTLTSGSPQSYCSYRVMARSEYDLFLGTSYLVNDDASDSEPIVGQAHHFVAQLTGLKDNVQDQFRLFSELTITTNINNDNQYQKPMFYSSGKYRSGCGYHLYFGVANFCEFNEQPFYATVYADDGNGYTIQRTTIGYCSAQATTPYPPNTCQNGGVFNPGDNSTCICPANFVGKFCEQIVCTNGGTPAGSFCLCPAGTGGTFCEQYACQAVNTKPDISFEGQSIAFVISARTSMQDAINKINNNIQTFTRDVQSSSSTWIKKWILLAVNSNTTILLVNSDKPADFVNGVNSLATNLSQYTVANEPSCSVQLEQGMLGAALLSEVRSSVWVFADSDGPDDMSYIQLFDIAQEYRLTLNLVGVGSTICTAPENNGQFPYYLRSLATTTFGDVYMTSQVDQIVFFIVSLYKSAVSHRYYFDDCTQPSTYYMPVDGWSQSLSLAVTGANLNSIQVTFPDGTLASRTDYEITAINEPELKLNQYIAACGNFWDHRQQNCFRFDGKSYGWMNSWSYCHDQNAFLVHIDSEETNNYVSTQTGPYRAWIGLVFTNGNWYWDVPDGNQAQPLTGYTNWADGVDPANPKYNYAVHNSDGKWEPAPVDEINFVACQKHRYGQGIYPGEDTNMIPAGLWKITVQSNSGSCSIQARSQSEIQVFYGFVTDPHSDYPENYANIDSSTNYILAAPTYISAFGSDTNPSLEGRLNYALLSYNDTVVNQVPFDNRQFCSYPFVSTAFTCPQNDGSLSDFSIKFTGIDQYGYAFERYSEALCTKFVLSCRNGGFLNNGQCVCREGWIGTTCNTPVCQNGGHEENGACVCDDEFGGTFCEKPLCEPPYPKSFKDTGRTLAILLETSTNMGATIFQLKRNLQAAFDSINSDPSTAGWFSNYILYPFDSVSNKASWYPKVETTNPADIVAAVKNISTMSCPGNAPCSAQCPRPIVTVLQEVLNLESFVSPNSVILVVTRSSPEDYLQVGQIANTLQESKAYVNFVFPSIDSPCGAGWNTPEANALYRIVGYSEGNTFTMSSVDFSTNFLKQYIPTLFQSGGLATNSNTANCTYEEILFQVEHEMFEFTLDFYHPLLNTIDVYDPAGEQMLLPDNLLSSDTNYIGIVQVNDTGATKAGTYRVVIKGGGGSNCFLGIRGRSSIELYLGFVDSHYDNFGGSTSDNAHYSPIAIENNTIVVHAQGLGNGVLRYAQIIAPIYGLVHTTELRKRDSQCSYEWYSTVPFAYDYDYYWIVIYGRDEAGAFLRRNFQVSVVNNRPPTPPPPAWCDMSAVKQDTLFIIDSSAKNSTTTFEILKHFASQSVVGYNYANKNYQVAAATLANTAQGGFPYNSNETSYDIVNSLIYNLKYDGSEGQNFTSALQFVLDTYDQNTNGYRTDSSVKHLLVYITQTNPTDVDPSALVATIKRSGLYGIVIVALDMEPTTALKNIVSDRCFYYAADYHDLMNYGVNFVQGQSCFRRSPCNI